MHSDPQANPETVWQARYGDGRTAQSVLCDVRLGDRGIEIGFPGAPQALVWPWGALGTAAPITGQATDALLTYSFMPGATLFVSDPQLVRAIVRNATQLSAASYGWRSARPWLVAAGVVACIFGAVWASDLSPTRALARLMPDDMRRTIGEQVVASMTGGHRACETPQGRAALDRLVARLSSASGSSKPFRVTVFDWDLLNAFAAPGEQIVLTRELINTARSPDEVAGVLAHEMGHGLELHPESGIVRVIGMTAAIELMLGGSGGALANVGVLLTQIGYTRAAEREADARGLGLLERAQISSAGLIDFFGRVGALEKKMGAPEWNILRTHPQSAERAKAAAEHNGYPATPAMDADDWQALRAMCGAARLPKPATGGDKL